MGTFVYSPDPLFPPGDTVDSTPVLQGFIEIRGGLNDHSSGAANPHTISGSGTYGGGIETAAVIGTTIPASGATHLWTMIDRLAAALSMALKGTAGGAPNASDWATLANGIPLLGGISQATATAGPGTVVRRDANWAANLGSMTIGGITAITNGLAQMLVNTNAAQSLPALLVRTSGGAAGFYVDGGGTNVWVSNGVTAAAFIGPLTGNASSATSATSLTGVNDLAHGGTGGTSAGTARASLSAAISGTNNDITALTATFTAAINPQQGGTGIQSPAAGSLLVGNGASAMTLIAPGTTGNVLQSSGGAWISQPFNAAVTIPAGGITSDRLGPLYPTPGVGAGNLLKAQVQGFAGFVPGATNPVFIQFAGGLSPALDPTGITGGQSRIDLLLLNNSGNLAIQQGIAKATPLISDVTVPNNCIPIWWMKIYSGATSITGYSDTGVNACFLAEARPLYSLGAGGGASGAPATGPTYATMNNEVATLPQSKQIGNKPFVTIGSDTDLTNETDLFLLASGTTGTVNTKDLSLWRVNPSRIGLSTTGAVLGDIILPYVSPNVAQLLIPGTGANLGKLVWNVSPTSGKVVVATSTDIRSIDYTSAAAQLVTTNAATSIGAGAAALMSVIADPSPAGVSYFNTTLQLASSAPPAGQIEIGRVYWDGSAFYNSTNGGMHFPALPMLGPANIRNIRGFQSIAPSANLALTNPPLALPGWTPFVLHVPVSGLTAKCNMSGLATQHAVRSMNLYLYLGYSAVVNGGSSSGPWTLAGNPVYFGTDLPLGVAGQRGKMTRVQGIPAGDVWFTFLYVLAGTAGDVWPSVGWAEIDIELGT